MCKRMISLIRHDSQYFNSIRMLTLRNPLGVNMVRSIICLRVPYMCDETFVTVMGTFCCHDDVVVMMMLLALTCNARSRSDARVASGCRRVLPANLIMVQARSAGLYTSQRQQ